MTEAIGKPAGRDFQQRDGDIARREDDRHGRRRDVLVLHPPEQIQRVGDPFHRDNAVEGIEEEVTSNRTSIRRHQREPSLLQHGLPV